jgi:hypothetical protein
MSQSGLFTHNDIFTYLRMDTASTPITASRKCTRPPPHSHTSIHHTRRSPQSPTPPPHTCMHIVVQCRLRTNTHTRTHTHTHTYRCNMRRASTEERMEFLQKFSSKMKARMAFAFAGLGRGERGVFQIQILAPNICLDPHVETVGRGGAGSMPVLGVIKWSIVLLSCRVRLLFVFYTHTYTHIHTHTHTHICAGCNRIDSNFSSVTTKALSIEKMMARIGVYTCIHIAT